MRSGKWHGCPLCACGQDITCLNCRDANACAQCYTCSSKTCSWYSPPKTESGTGYTHGGVVDLEMLREWWTGWDRTHWYPTTMGLSITIDGREQRFGEGWVGVIGYEHRP
jgi:hypothetical protein